MAELLAGGVVFAIMGIVAIAIDEGVSGLRHPLDFRGSVENIEPIKRVGSHLFLLMGLLMLGGWAVLAVLGARRETRTQS